MKKNCRDCAIELTFENRSNGFKSLCKSCYCLYMKKYYVDKPDKYEKHKKEYVKVNDDSWRINVQILMAERFIFGCIDCGEINPIVLEFDHRIPSEKSFSFGYDKNTKRPIDDFIKELDKCDVVCANCHRIRTAKMFGSWRLDLPKINKI